MPQPPFVFGYEAQHRHSLGLHDAIEAEHAATGRYPDQLPPFDPMLGVDVHGSPDFLPWYRSDGSNYKLLAEDPHDCYAVSEGWPGMIDPSHPVDGGCAYGF